MLKTIIAIYLSVFLFGCTTKNSGTFVDERDSHEYKWVRIGSQIWMAENLAWLPEINPIEESSVSEPRYYIYGNTSDNVEMAKKQTIKTEDDDSTKVYEEYGVLYNWPAVTNGQNTQNDQELRGACPTGWHVPSDKEWMELEHHMGMVELDLPAFGRRVTGEVAYLLKSTYLWDRSGNGIDSVGLNIKPSGQAYSGIEYLNGNEKAVFWTSTSDVNNDIWVREMSCCDNGIIRKSEYKEEGFAVRCVKD